MKVTLFKVAEHPDRTAISKIDGFVVGGAFLLDFSRPLDILRWFGVSNSRLGLFNRWLGYAVGLGVPVIHQGEQEGGYVVSVDRSDPYFEDLRALWKAHYPSKATPLSTEANGLKIIADFANQFPDDVKSPSRES